MPLVQVKVAATGQTAWVTEEDARAGQDKGVYQPVGKVLAKTETGDRYAVEGGQDLALQGLQTAEASDVADLAQAEADAEIAGGLGGAARSFYQGGLDSATLGLASALASDEDKQQIARLRREQGAAYAGGRLTVDVATGIAGASKGALGAASRLLPAGQVARVSERLVAGGVAGSRALGAVGAGALEGAAGAAADYLADSTIREKPGLSGEAFAVQLGAGALLGGGIGGALGGVGSALERRAARRQAGNIAPAADDVADAAGTERAAMAAVDELAEESDRIPLSSLVPPRAATPEGVAERVSGVYGALRQADAERVALQREIDDGIMPGLDTLPTEQAQALRDELGQATAAYRTALDDAKGWARGIDREQRALTRARLDEERVRQAAARTRGVEETIEQRLERERLRTQRVAEGPSGRRRATAGDGGQETPTAIPAGAPGDDLLAQLQRTQDQIGAGRSLSDVSAEGAAAAPKRARRGRQPKIPDGFEHGPHIPATAPRIKGIPDVDSLDEDALYVVRASDLRARGDKGLAEGVQDGRKDSIKRGWSEGKKFEPIDVTIYNSGKVEISQGRHRLWAAAEEGRDIPVRFSRGIEEPAARGKDAVAEWLAKYKRNDGVHYVDTATGAPSRGFMPRSVDKVVSFDGPTPADLPAPLDLSEFRAVRPGEAAEQLTAMRARDPGIELNAALARERAGVAAATAKSGAIEAAEDIAEASFGAQQVGRILDGDSDDAVDVFAKLDEAAEQMRAAIARARQAPAQGGAAAVALPDVPAQASPGLGRRIAGAAQNVGSALEVASALGVPVPSAAGIPVVGPALSSYLKLRAAWRALRGTGASLPATPAARAAAARVRIEAAARASVQRTLQLGEAALKSTLLPGLAGRQAGRLADRLLADDADEQRSMRADVEGVLAANPDAPRIDVARAAVGTPAEVTGAAQEAASRAVSYLQSVAPKTAGQGTPWDLGTRYTPLQVTQWQERSTAVRSPAEAASALAAGVRAPWAKEALVQVWPEIWGLWREELTRQQDVLARLPRPQRLAIGASFDIPLDPVQMPTYPRPSPQAAQQPQPSHARPSSRPRLAELAATDDQREELR